MCHQSCHRVSTGQQIVQPSEDRSSDQPIGQRPTHADQATLWADAVTSIRENAEKYNVDPDRIGAAGGHLSLLVGLTDPDSNLEGESGTPNQSSRVQAVVNVFGPTQMADCYETSSVAWVFRLFTGGTHDEVPEQYKTASPLTYVSKDDPPVLTLHGDQDMLVPVEQAKLLDRRMKAAGAPHTLMIFEGQGHGFEKEHQQKSMDAMWDFFDQHLNY